MACAVKHDGRHKARLVAGGHLTETPIDSACSSVVSLRGARLLAFLGELNGLKIWSTDVGNAYLETHTKEKVHVIAGPEFGDREGHVLVVSKALHGLHSSGLRWSERLADVLREMGFFVSKAEKDIWMRDNGDHYECIAVHVDGLLIASKDPDSIIKLLTEKHQFKLKGTGPTEFHLGCDFFHDEEGVLCYGPKKYIHDAGLFICLAPAAAINNDDKSPPDGMLAHGKRSQERCSHAHAPFLGTLLNNYCIYAKGL